MCGWRGRCRSVPTRQTVLLLFADSLGADNHHRIQFAGVNAVDHFFLGHFIFGRQHHLALDAHGAFLGQQPLHFVFEVLADDVVLGQSHDKDAVERRHRQPGDHPAFDDFRFRRRGEHERQKNCCGRDDTPRCCHAIHGLPLGSLRSLGIASAIISGRRCGRRELNPHGCASAPDEIVEPFPVTPASFHNFAEDAAFRA